MSENTGNKLYLLSYITMPFILDLYKSLKEYNIDKSSVPNQFGCWDKYKNAPNAPFFMRFIYARNISSMFMLMTSIAIIFN